ncbi:MAG: DUF4185 domain-containing protein [Actinomycetia bacterium]|nr:DUF4185 domain-containing protein [Actinomycetes bacterium]MCL2731410.1 DUF4185 domain-containing protein [Actinomycetes bacterium]
MSSSSVPGPAGTPAPQDPPTTEAAAAGGGRSPARRAVIAGLFGAALGGSGLLPGTAGAATPPAGKAVATGAAPGTGTAVSAGVSPALITGAKVANLTGPAETGPFAAPWTDLGIPARCPDGSLLFVCGDTFDGSGVGGPDWRAPVGLRSSSSNLSSVRIDGAVGGSHAVGLVPEGHAGGTTAIPSDVFTVGDTMYMHLMRGVIYQTDHSDFWRSTDNGQTWEYLCQWPGGQYGGQFQQKTYAVADDGYCYVLSTAFNRDVVSGLLLHRVPQTQLGTPAAYQPWGYAGGAWAWGNAPTTITGARRWGEICFRAMGGKYAFTWLNMDVLSMRAQIFALPTSNLFTTPEQTMIVPTAPGLEIGNAVASPYGGFILPGSTFADFHIAVSQWYDNQNYRVMHYRINGLDPTAAAAPAK